MVTKRLSVVLLALFGVGFGFLITLQWRAQLIVPSNRVAQNQALVLSVQALEQQNAKDRSNLAALRRQLLALEGQAAQKSDQVGQLSGQVQLLRELAGATTLRGPGVTVHLSDGKPGPTAEGQTAWVVTYADVQDVVNLLYQGGAEGVSVNAHRLSPLSGFQGSGGTVVIDQGPPLLAPFTISAVGNRSQMQLLLGENGTLGDLRLRQRLYGVGFSWTGQGEITLPATDASLEVQYAHSP